MPSDIQNFVNLDYRALFASIVIFMAGWVALKTLLTKFSEATGIEFPWTKKEREVTSIQKKVDVMDGKIASISEVLTNLKLVVEELSLSVKSLNERTEANEAAQLKDRISEAYRYYHEKQQWNQMEREAFNDLIKAYTRYSDNSFVHTVCEPESLMWHIVDKD